MTLNGDKNSTGWGAKEKILTIFGLSLIAFSAITFAFLPDHPFNAVFVIAGAAFCGVALAQVGDKK